MKKLIFLMLITLTLIGCKKESMYKHAVQLSAANKKSLNYEKLPFLVTSFVMKNEADLERLNANLLERWNAPQNVNIYRIDTSWIEEAPCMGCKNW